ncbi:hypothetical protein N8537_03380 [Synechococcus sp. AH-601-J22]|nr:hypothetical protein [Synechococcus sp. AH-601-J22]
MAAINDAVTETVMKNTKGNQTALKIAFLSRNARAVTQLLRPLRPRYAASATKTKTSFAAFITSLMNHLSGKYQYQEGKT